MKKIITAALAGLALTLSACSGESESSPVTSTEAAETTLEQASGVQELILSEPMTVTRCGGDIPCEIEITLEEATLTETCPYGVSYPDMQAMDPEGTIYLTFEGEFHVIDAKNNFSVSETDFTAVDPDKFATTNLIAYDCEDLDVDKHLSNPVDPGLKRAGHIILAIPENTQTVRFTQFWDPVTYEFDVTDLDIEPGAGERPLPSSSPATSTGKEETTHPTMASAESSDDTTQSNSASMWNEPGVGYNCAATDAWTNDPANCTSENLGGDASYDTYWGPDAAIAAGEVPQDLNQERVESHAWWNECIATNSAEYCRANDPWQQ